LTFLQAIQFHSSIAAIIWLNNFMLICLGVTYKKMLRIKFCIIKKEKNKLKQGEERGRK